MSRVFIYNLFYFNIKWMSEMYKIYKISRIHTSIHPYCYFCAAKKTFPCPWDMLPIYEHRCNSRINSNVVLELWWTCVFSLWLVFNLIIPRMHPIIANAGIINYKQGSVRFECLCISQTQVLRNNSISKQYR